MIFNWRVVALDDLSSLVVQRCGAARPAVLAVNGHSSSGKTTLAGRLAATLPAAAVLHTDDLAWHQGVFGWDELLRDQVLPVVRSEEALDYRPPQWQARSRTGSITLPGGLGFLLVEGVGASQASLRDVYDLVIWVETEEPTRSARDLVRLAGGEMSAGSFERWMTEENAYTTRERPWEHADLVVYGGGSIPHDPNREVVIADT
ncbi:MAG TPA: hypothetical protein VNT24_02605 [Propionibacteriaceae bacterium]|nr:hypothetical protein [Propionibacteriaceae bacterium]